MDVTVTSPNEMFIVTCRLWNWLLRSSFKNVAENIIADCLTGRWQKIVEQQKFLLRQPMIGVPAIEAVMGQSAEGTVRIARLLLAAEITVNYTLSPKLRSELEEHCLQNQQRDTSRGK